MRHFLAEKVQSHPPAGEGSGDPASLHQLGPLVTGHWGKPSGLSRDVGSHGGPSSFSDASQLPIGRLFSRNLTPLRFRRNFSFCQTEPSVLLQTHACVKQPRAQAQRRQRWTGLTSHKPLPLESREKVRSAFVRVLWPGGGNCSPSSLGATPVNDVLAFSLSITLPEHTGKGPSSSLFSCQCRHLINS